MPDPLIHIPEEEIEFSFIRAQGSGGQNVNKVSSAVQLRFNIQESSLSEMIKTRLLNLSDRRVTKDGIIIIKAQRHRTQEKNRREALDRLYEMIRLASQTYKKRIATRPSRQQKMKRLDAKLKRGKTKLHRQKIDPAEH